MSELETILQEMVNELAPILAKNSPDADPQNIGKAARHIVLGLAHEAAEFVTAPTPVILGKERTPAEVMDRDELLAARLMTGYTREMTEQHITHYYHYLVGKHMYRIARFENGELSKIRRIF